MNKINYNERIDLQDKINELLMINIDDDIKKNDDNNFLNLTGDIKISGQVSIENQTKDFTHSIKVDISLSKDQLEDKDVTISIEDFTYKIDENYIDIDIIMKLDGLKEIETSFPTNEDQEIIEIEPGINDDIIEETNTNIEVPTKDESSLISKIFKTREIKKEKVYLLHVVKNETTYEEIAAMYNIDIDLIKQANDDKELEKGKLIFIPHSK